MVIYVDIDDTICTTEGTDYKNAKPIICAIRRINKYYEMGNTIIYWTARGTGSGIDWSEVTKQQFKDWGVKYHELKFGKPIWDVFIDDKNINSRDWLNNPLLDLLND